MKTIFFDWAGVVASDTGEDFLHDLLAKTGATDEQISDIFKKYMSQFTRGKISEQGFWNILRTDYSLTIPDSISGEFASWSGLIANDKILSLIKSLKTKEFKIALLTNVFEPTYRMIEKAGYYNYFDVVIASFKVGYGKPDKEIYEIALDMAGAKAEESLFIDDRQAFLDPAKAIGFTTILATSPVQIISDVNTYVLSRSAL